MFLLIYILFSILLKLVFLDKCDPFLIGGVAFILDRKHLSGYFVRFALSLLKSK